MNGVNPSSNTSRPCAKYSRGLLRNMVFACIMCFPPRYRYIERYVVALNRGHAFYGCMTGDKAEQPLCTSPITRPPISPWKSVALLYKTYRLMIGVIPLLPWGTG